MDRVTSLPQAMVAIKICGEISSRIKALAAEVESETAKLTELGSQIRGFFVEETFSLETKSEAPKSAEDAGISVPTSLNPALLPSLPPKKLYEKAIALIEASADPNGLTFREIKEAWCALKWKGHDNPKLDSSIRDALKTARKSESNKTIQHGGSRNGKFRIVA